MSDMNRFAGSGSRRNKDAKAKKQVRNKQVGLIVTPDLYQRVKNTAALKNTTVNSFINDLLEQNTLTLEETKKFQELREDFLKSSDK